MKISELLNESSICNYYYISKDVSFDTLALAGAKIDRKFCTFIDDEKYIADISPMAIMILTKEKFKKNLIEQGKNVCIVDNPRIAFFKLHNYLCSKKEYIRNFMPTQIGMNCTIGKLTSIADNNVKIGNNVVIEDFVSIKENVIIGDNSIVRSGTVIGGTGFEFKKNENKEVISVKHIGGVVIGKNVEIQNNTCIDKAIYPWDDTVINDDTKIDNLVHISHAVKIKENCMIVAGAVIGGRASIGKNCWVGLNATIRNGVKVGDNSRVNMGAVVTKDVNESKSVTGNFAIPHKDFIEIMKKKVK